ncbi:unnamed protein product [Cunninghamella echinulata]
MKVNYLLFLSSLMYMNQGLMGQLTNDTITTNLPTTTTLSPNTATLEPTTTTTIATESTPPTQNGPVPCSDQPVFELCLKNQENYINGCRTDEFACLCRWHSSKLSCFDNCPLDTGKETQAGLVKHMCSQPGANVTLPIQSFITPSSSILPSATGLTPSSSSSNPSSKDKNAANSQIHCPSEMYLFLLLLFITGFLI